MRIYQSFFLWRLALVRLRRLCLFIFKRRFFLRLPMWYLFVVLYVFENKKTRAFRWEGAGRKTGNNLLSHGSEAALPSATEGLTNVFGMETCVSPRLWSPDWYPAECRIADGIVVTAAVRDYGKNSLTSGNASAVRKNGDYDERNVSDH